MEKVTAIITTHNRLNLLKQAIDSVRRQTYPDIELIVVDDGSTDGTEAYCRRQPLKYIRVEAAESRGGNHARNLGIRAAEGKYIAFLDDDDRWLPEKTARQVRLIEEKGCEMVFCGMTVETVRAGIATYTDILPHDSHRGDMSRAILYTIPAVTSTMLFSRDALIDAGLFDEKLNFWQEYELSIRLAQRGPFFFVAEPLAIYRVDTGDRQRKTNKYALWLKAVEYVKEKHRDLYAMQTPTERLRTRLLINGDARARCKCSGRWLTSFWLHLKGIALRRRLRAGQG